jgi:hypothetical protein
MAHFQVGIKADRVASIGYLVSAMPLDLRNRVKPMMP